MADTEARRSLFGGVANAGRVGGSGYRCFPKAGAAVDAWDTGRQGRGGRDSEIRLKQVSRSYIIQGARS